MLATERGRYIMSDAWVLYEDALEMLRQGYIRNAADKAWGATKRATDALILERLGQEPVRTTQTSAGIRDLRCQSEALRSLHTRYLARVSELHGDCFYDGHCEPGDYFEEMIRETAAYISDAESLAAESNQPV